MLGLLGVKFGIGGVSGADRVIAKYSIRSIQEDFYYGPPPLNSGALWQQAFH